SALRASVGLDNEDYRAFFHGQRPRLRSKPIFSGGIFGQVVTPDGRVIGLTPDTPAIAVPDFAVELTARPGSARFFDSIVDGVPVRVLAVSGSEGGLVEVARSVREVNQLLDWLQITFFLIAAGGVAVAAGLGLLVGRAALKPVERLTAETEEVRA